MNLKAFLPGVLGWGKEHDKSFVYFGDEYSNSQLHVKQCGYMWCKSGYSYGPAIRDHLLIHFVLSGKGEVSIDEKRFEVGEGQLFVIPPNAVSYYGADQQQPWSYYYVGFKGEWAQMILDLFMQDKTNAYLRTFNMDKVHPLLKEMCARMLEEDGYLHLMSGMYKLISILCDTRSVGEIERSMVKREQVEPLINKVITKIEQRDNVNTFHYRAFGGGPYQIIKK